MRLSWRTLVTRAAALLWLAATLAATMHPLGRQLPVPFWGFLSETMAGVDYAQNVVLFLPLGWIAHRGGWRWWQVTLAGFLLSGGIELAQLWVPGRTSQATDILFNTSGAALGWWMASRPRQPRVRLGLTFGALGGFLALHAMNTRWPDAVELAGGSGAWSRVTRVMCPGGVREGTACFRVPNDSAAGNRYLRVVGVGDLTYARVQASVRGRPLGVDDCVMEMFEQTVEVRLRLRPPLALVCGVADASERTVTLLVHPRLEHEWLGGWSPTRAGVWMWPVWPFPSYQPMQQVAVAAVTFVALAALMMGSAWWAIPAGYLAILELTALFAGFRTPGTWELFWTVVGWGVAAVVVWGDRRWRGAS
jgi:hypothetical protein